MHRQYPRTVLIMRPMVDRQTEEHAGLPLLLLLLLAMVVIGVWGCALCRLFRRAALGLWHQFLHCFCAVNLRLREMDEGVHYMEEISWGLN
ncbi:hypothetical protein ACOMHN_058270 [Nucella lapillus]